MIKKISGLCLLCCLIIGIPLAVQAQDTDKNSPKKELVMDEDELVEALTKIGLAIQEMENENKDDILALSYLANLYSTNSSGCNQSKEVARVLNARFDRLESLLYDMMMAVENTNNKGKNVVIKRNKQLPSTIVQEAPNQDDIIEELKKQIQEFEKQTASMQEQINALKKSKSDSIANSNFGKLLIEMSLINAELNRQNKTQKKQVGYLTEERGSEAEIARLKKSEEDLEKELNEIKQAQANRELIRNSEANLVAVVPVPKAQSPKEPPKEEEVQEVQEELPSTNEQVLEKESAGKKEFLTENESSKKSEQELKEELSKKVEKKQVFFGFDSYQLSPDAKKLLDEIAVQINAKGTITATILGLSSPEGNPVYNKKLAQKRSREVYNYFVSKGISTDRIKDLDADIDKEVTVPANGRRVDILINL